MLDVSTRYSHGTQRSRKTRALNDRSITRAEDRKDGPSSKLVKQIEDWLCVFSSLEIQDKETWGEA